MNGRDDDLAGLAGSVLSRESDAVAALVGATETAIVAVARRVFDTSGLTAGAAGAESMVVGGAPVASRPVNSPVNSTVGRAM